LSGKKKMTKKENKDSCKTHYEVLRERCVCVGDHGPSKHDMNG